MVRGAWCVFSTSGLPGGGENLLPPLGGHLPHWLGTKVVLKFVLVHVCIFRQLPTADSQLLMAKSFYFVIERTQPLAQFV